MTQRGGLGEGRDKPGKEARTQELNPQHRRGPKSTDRGKPYLQMLFVNKEVTATSSQEQRGCLQGENGSKGQGTASVPTNPLSHT